MKKYLFILIVLNGCLFSCNYRNNSETTRSTENSLSDSVNQYIDRGNFRKALQIALQEQNDTLRSQLLSDISFGALQENDSALFLHANTEAKKLAVFLDDSVRIATSYWDLGEYYNNHFRSDSAYFYYDKAQKIYQQLGDELSSGKLLLNMAIIQKNIKDYTGSEVTTANAISLLAPLKDYFSLYRAYNNLGIVFNELEEYEKSLAYHTSALENLKKSGELDWTNVTYNNIGVVYTNKKDYSKAVEYFKKALHHSENLEETDPKLYAMVLDNQGYAQLYLEDSTGAYRKMLKALEIREKLNPPKGISVSHLHLADYFLYKGDTATAVNHALIAEEVATKNNNSRDILLALKFLSNTANTNALNYSKRYIAINDSLYKQERAVRNKFARIRFETDKYISETERLNQRVIRLSVLASVIFLIFVLLFIIKSQHSKNKLIRQKQEADEEIYDLLSTQQKEIEKGKEKEKQRISRELHDGILSRLFGLRLSLDSLNEADDTESKQKRADYIREMQKVAQEIRLISRRLGKDSLIEVDFKMLLKELVRKQPEALNIQLLIGEEIDWEKIDNNIKVNLYRIIQEALSNIYRHAQATEAKLEITNINNKLRLLIQDNGIGFDQDRSTEGIGLKNIKERNRALNGKLNITSDAQGTSIQIEINQNRK